MAKTDTPITDVDETMIERILELFQSNTVAVEYGNDPAGWVDQNLPEGTEAADVARCMPEVAERLGGPYQANAVRYNTYHGSTASPACHSAVNELSYTYNTIYQQNTFIYAEEGSQVVNIQGDGNHVTQEQLDVDFDVDIDVYEGDHYEQGEEYEEGEQAPGHADDEMGHDTDEDTDDAEGEHGDDGEDGDEVDPVDPPAHGEHGWDDPTGEEPDPMGQPEQGWEDPTGGEEPDGWDQPTQQPDANPFEGGADQAPDPAAGDVGGDTPEAAEML